MRTCNRLWLENLAAQVKRNTELLKVLNCDHSITDLSVESLEVYDMDRGCLTGEYSNSYKEVCHDCGKYICNLTKREYLELKLERSKTACAAERDELKAKLEALEDD